MIKLKPCPFCGREACIQRHEFIGYTDTFGVVCLDCCCETRQFFETKEEAIEAWNRRKEGRWIDVDDHVMCSCCGATHYGADKNYCPNCGADMRKETEDE